MAKSNSFGLGDTLQRPKRKQFGKEVKDTKQTTRIAKKLAEEDTHKTSIHYPTSLYKKMKIKAGLDEMSIREYVLFLAQKDLRRVKIVRAPDEIVSEKPVSRTTIHFPISIHPKMVKKTALAGLTIRRYILGLIYEDLEQDERDYIHNERI